MLTCLEITELCTEFEEGTLSWKDWARFQVHLRICPACMEYVEQMRLTADALAKLPPAEMDPATRAKLAQLFRDFHADQENDAD